ncbi:MAG: branched-chain amino acid ABC transporter permease [Xanthobacteraceae bacterium]|nr:branched-chain amino acid ABC transporter permease [Xanthobacteraceae bacterium]MBX3535577.1 branched-chain amino acid ABC transporter permease [Xanthobacteraceae bacterium]MCW5673682.1 branched-chain amino acid ABC transporter permease [Xanthobacteraceae bacterium]MCW5678484.1 branched-chain amino acid ABC transporter permease [Xanthobacteraceae bacterium]
MAVETKSLPASAPTQVSWSELIAFVLMVSFLIVAPLFIYPVFLMKVLCFALFACAFNLLIGYVGLLSFGHALFFGWSSYVAAHLAKVGKISIPYWSGHWIVIPLPPLPPELAILGGTAVAALFGLIAGSLAIRRQGIYFAMVTLALAQMMFFFALQAPFTGGEDGIQGVPRGVLFGVFDLSNIMTMYFTVFVIFVVCFLLIYRIIYSPFGEVLKAIRENEPRAISLGYKTERYKLAAFVLSATLTGVAGSTKAIVFQLASLTDVDWPMSGEVVLMTLLGGLGTVFGPALGASIIITMQNYLASAGDITLHIFGFTLAMQPGQWVPVIQGAIFVICVLLFRRGIVGEIANFFRIRL